MNASQIHLALTHVPVILSFIGLIILIIALVRKNDILTKTSFYIFFFSALFTLPVFFTGEGAEKTVEHMHGVTESVIARHEMFANISLVVIAIAGIMSLIGLFLYKKVQLLNVIKVMTLIISIGAAGVMAQTAHLGGQIRHTEISAGALNQANDALQSGTESANEED